MIEVDLAGQLVYAQVWKVQVGRVSLFLLDTNIPANARSEDRNITKQLYGGDHEMRIRQEILLGVGGYRALQAIGLEPTVYHMNEGHSAFLALEHILHLMKTRNLSLAEARELASASLVFTTHTPVEAGHDYFHSDLVNRYFGQTARQLGLSPVDFMNLGRTHGNGAFCMTVLALRLAANCTEKSAGKCGSRFGPAFRLRRFPSVTSPTEFTSGVGSQRNSINSMTAILDPSGARNR
jgi:starch phosphorylase